MDNSNDIVVFFKNHKKARFRGDRAFFAGDVDDETIRKAVSDGKAVINWENVCFAQKWVEHKEDVFGDAE